MAADGSQELSPGAVLNERYRLTERLGEGAAWLGVDIEHETPVVVLKVSAAHSSALKSALTLKHQHLAQALDVLEYDGRHLLVSEHVQGVSLRDRLDAAKTLSAVDAVRTALRVADALTSLHEHGSVHGFVHDRALIVALEGDRPLPVLTFLPTAAAENARAPESDLGAPGVADDAWAVAALLYEMLVGQAPARSGYASESELEAQGITDPALRATLAHALASEPERRPRDLKPLRRELARWFVEHAGEEPVPLTSHPSKAPPPLPSNAPKEAAAPIVTSAPPARRSSGRMGTFVVAAIGLGIIAGGVFSSLLKNEPEVALASAQAPAPTPPPKSSAIELTEVPVTGKNESVMEGDKLGSCVAGYLPPKTFATAPDLSFVCSETDPQRGADKLRSAIVSGAPKGQLTDAMKIFARLGWYELAAFAVVRAGCCPEAPPLSIPSLSESCQFNERLRELGEAVVAMKPVEPVLARYTSSIHCELNLGGKPSLRRKERPAGGEDTAFLELVRKLEAP